MAILEVRRLRSGSLEEPGLFLDIDHYRMALLPETRINVLQNCDHSPALRICV